MGGLKPSLILARNASVQGRIGIPLALGILVLSQFAAAANAQAVARPELHAERATTPPKLDGVLDDAAWAHEPMALEPWVSYNPLRGEPEKQRTSVAASSRTPSSFGGVVARSACCSGLATAWAFTAA